MLQRLANLPIKNLISASKSSFAGFLTHILFLIVFFI